MVSDWLIYALGLAFWMFGACLNLVLWWLTNAASKEGRRVSDSPLENWRTPEAGAQRGDERRSLGATEAQANPAPVRGASQDRAALTPSSHEGE